MAVTLFYDRSFFESDENVRFDIVHPDRREVSLTFPEPWEGVACTYQSAVQDPATGRVLLYYRGTPDASVADLQVTCVAVSGDGAVFEKPRLGLIDFHGSRDNNIVYADHNNLCHNFAPFYDTNPSCPPDQRFKAVAGMLESGGIFMLASPDGLRWRLLSDRPAITDGTFDSLNTAFYDESAGLYRCYSRAFSGKGYSGTRIIQSCTSPDFLHWTKPVPNVYAMKKPVVQHLYTNSTRPVPDGGGLLLSLPMRFQPERKKVASHPWEGVSDCILMFSRDGENWDIPFVQPWIYPGIDERLWTQRNFIMSAGFAATGDEWSFYATEHYRWDDVRIARYSVPRYHLASVYSEEGGFVTKPFTSASGVITLNYRTSAYGTLTVKVLDADGAVLEGFGAALYGNELAAPVNVPAGRPVRLSVTLEDAYLYAAAL